MFCCPWSLAPHWSRSTASTHMERIMSWRVTSTIAVASKVLGGFCNMSPVPTHLCGRATTTACSWRDSKGGKAAGFRRTPSQSHLNSSDRWDQIDGIAASPCGQREEIDDLWKARRSPRLNYHKSSDSNVKKTRYNVDIGGEDPTDGITPCIYSSQCRPPGTGSRSKHGKQD